VTDRRTTIKWMLSVAASMPLLNQRSWSQEVTALPAYRGYGTDPDLTKLYRPGDAWPLTLSRRSGGRPRRFAMSLFPMTALANAEGVGVVDFIDEWVSAPYPRQAADRPSVLEAWPGWTPRPCLRFEKYFAELDPSQAARDMR